MTIDQENHGVQLGDIDSNLDQLTLPDSAEPDAPDDGVVIWQQSGEWRAKWDDGTVATIAQINGDIGSTNTDASFGEIDTGLLYYYDFFNQEREYGEAYYPNDDQFYFSYEVGTTGNYPWDSTSIMRHDTSKGEVHFDEFVNFNGGTDAGGGADETSSYFHGGLG